MTATNTDSLGPPTGLDAWIETTGTREVIHNQGFQIPREWWMSALEVAGRPTDQFPADVVTRDSLFDMASGADSDPVAAERLLWNSVAWGLGKRKRLVKKRIASFAADPEALSAALVEAARLSKTDPEAAYSLLQPGRPLIKYLGPAFFTKFLYFAGEGAADHPSLILDQRVATALNRFGWKSLPTQGGWAASAYGRYASLTARWTTELNCPRRDLIERYLFDRGA